MTPIFPPCRYHPQNDVVNSTYLIALTLSPTRPSTKPWLFSTRKPWLQEPRRPSAGPSPPKLLGAGTSVIVTGRRRRRRPWTSPPLDDLPGFVPTLVRTPGYNASKAALND